MDSRVARAYAKMSENNKSEEEEEYDFSKFRAVFDATNKKIDFQLPELVKKMESDSAQQKLMVERHSEFIKCFMPSFSTLSIAPMEEIELQREGLNKSNKGLERSVKSLEIIKACQSTFKEEWKKVFAKCNDHCCTGVDLKNFETFCTAADLKMELELSQLEKS